MKGSGSGDGRSAARLAHVLSSTLDAKLHGSKAQDQGSLTASRAQLVAQADLESPATRLVYSSASQQLHALCSASSSTLHCLQLPLLELVHSYPRVHSVLPGVALIQENPSEGCCTRPFVTSISFWDQCRLIAEATGCTVCLRCQVWQHLKCQ